MSSMTDIVFLLLIFFLVTSTLINPNALKLLLPKSDSQVSAKPMLSLSIVPHADSTYSYHIDGNRIPVAKRDIRDSLVLRLSQEEEKTFSIHADRSVPISEVVDIMNIAKDEDFKVILATQAH